MWVLMTLWTTVASWRGAPVTRKLERNDVSRARQNIPPHLLREAFIECKAVSTQSWLRYRRLARARRQLLQASRDGRGVTEIAMENGFLHLGRFAGFYADTFAESPIETIRRRPVRCRAAAAGC